MAHWRLGRTRRRPYGRRPDSFAWGEDLPYWGKRHSLYLWAYPACVGGRRPGGGGAGFGSAGSVTTSGGERSARCASLPAWGRCAISNSRVSSSSLPASTKSTRWRDARGTRCTAPPASYRTDYPTIAEGKRAGGATARCATRAHVVPWLPSSRSQAAIWSVVLAPA